MWQIASRRRLLHITEHHTANCLAPLRVGRYVVVFSLQSGFALPTVLLGACLQCSIKCHSGDFVICQLVIYEIDENLFYVIFVEGE